MQYNKIKHNKCSTIQYTWSRHICNTLLDTVKLFKLFWNHPFAVSVIFAFDAFVSSIAAFKRASSAWRNTMKACELDNSTWSATRCKNFSNDRRRDSTNSGLNRPTDCLSGIAGIIMPGYNRVSSPISQTKSEYLRITADSRCSNSVLVVAVLIL